MHDVRRDRPALDAGGRRRVPGELGRDLEQASGGEAPRRTVLVIGELDEGPWWWGQLAGPGAGDGGPDGEVPADPGELGLTAGRPLRIEFRRADGDYEAVPVFVLA